MLCGENNLPPKFESEVILNRRLSESWIRQIWQLFDAYKAAQIGSVNSHRVFPQELNNHPKETKQQPQIDATAAIQQ